jgi:hypothetical protein
MVISPVYQLSALGDQRSRSQLKDINVFAPKAEKLNAES